MTILTLLTSTLSLYYLVSDTTSPRDGDVAIERVIFELVERASSWIVSHSWITDSTTTSTKFGYIQIYFPLSSLTQHHTCFVTHCWVHRDL